MRPSLLAACLFLLLLAAPAGARGDVPQPIDLTQGWTFERAGGEPQPVSVPHVIDPQPLETLFGGTTGTYRLTFDGPPTFGGFGWALRFEQVRRIARVTLNGVEIGQHRDPYVPFVLPATSLLPGQPNVLEVAVDNRKGREPREGWWNWGGITRPVSLVPQGPVVLEDPAVLPQVDCTGPGRCSAEVLVDGWLRNRSDASVVAQMELELSEPETEGGAGEGGGGGSELAARRTQTLRPLPAGARRRVRFVVPVRGTPRLWSPRSPQRYSAVLRTRVGEEAVQSDRMRVGLREVAVRGGRLELNGRRVALRGASIQEDVPGRGPALTEADMDRIVADLEAVGATVTRAHYLLNPGLLDRLDAAGILVWTQAPVYHRDVLLRTPAQRRIALDSLRDTVLAARTHPSVMTHSVANELSSLPDTLPGTATYLRDARRLVEDLDPTLPTSVDVLAYPRTPKQRAYEGYDLLGINSYYGWYKGKPDRSVADLRGLAPFLRTTRRQYPDKALVITEFGAEATERGPASRKQTYAFQADYLARTLDVVDRIGFVDGAIYWTLQEFAVKPRWDGGALRADIRTDAIHNKGLIAYGGARKPAWGVAKQRFAAADLFPEPTDPGGGNAAPPAAASGAPGGGSPGGGSPGGGGSGGGSDDRATGVGEVALAGGVVLSLLSLLAFDVWCFLGIRAERREAELADVVALRPSAPALRRLRA